MVLLETFSFKVTQNFFVQSTAKNCFFSQTIIIKTIYGVVRTECSSCTVYYLELISESHLHFSFFHVNRHKDNIVSEPTFESIILLSLTNKQINKQKYLRLPLIRILCSLCDILHLQFHGVFCGSQLDNFCLYIINLKVVLFFWKNRPKNQGDTAFN